MDTVFDILSQVSHRGVYLTINGIWIGTLLSIVLWLFWRRSTPTNAATRYAVWWVLMALVIVLPLLAGGTSLRFDFRLPETNVAQMADEPAAITEGLPPAVHEVGVIPAASTIARKQVLAKHTGEPARSQEPKVKPARVEKTQTVNASGRSLGSLLMGLLPVVMLSLWLAIAGYLTARLYQAYRRFVAIKHRAAPLEVRELGALGRRLRLAVGRRTVRLALSNEIDYPVAAGLGDPTIILPEQLLDKLTEPELEAILLHELAHIRRRDDWFQLAQKMLQAVLFFHPAVHLIARQLDLERELACDDQVMVHTGQPNEYYHCLTRLVQVTTGQGTTLVPGALSGRKQIFKRFERLLSRKKGLNARLSVWRGAAVVATLSFLLLLVLQVAPVLALPAEPVTLDEIDRTLMVHDDAEPVERPTPRPIVITAPTPAPTAYEPIIPEDLPVLEEPSPTDYSFIDDDFQIDAGLVKEDLSVPEVPAAPDEPEPISEVPSAPASPDAVYALLDEKPLTGGGPISDAFEWIEELFDESSSTSESNGTTTMTWTSGGDRLTVHFKGELVFSEDDNTISAIERNGYFALEEKRNGRRREIDIQPNVDGTLEFTYFESRREQPYDEAAQAWFKGLLPEIIRATGIGAEDRVRRILKRDGVAGVLVEIDKLDRDWVIRKYAAALFASDAITEDDMPAILTRTLGRMDSDYEMAELLIAAADNSHHSPAVMASYVEAARMIDSDYELRRVISELDLDRETPPQMIATVFDLARQIESDYERAELLIELADIADENPDLHREYLLAAEDIDSDYELRRVISSINYRHNLSDESLAEVLALAEALESDYEKAELLIELADDCTDPTLKMKLLNVATTLDSDYEIRRVLSTQRYDCTTDQQMIIGTMHLLQQISSDYERTEGLIELVECAVADKAVRGEYFTCLETMSSDYEAKRVILAYIQESRLEDDSEVLNLLTAVAGLESDYEQAEVLKKLARRCRGTEVLEEAFLNIVDGMDSDYEASELYRKLYRRDRDRENRDDG